MSSNDKRLDQAEPYYKELTKESLEGFLLDICKKKPRKMTFSTSRLGAINYEMAIWEATAEWNGKPHTEKERIEQRKKVNKLYPHKGLYTFEV